MFFHLQYIHLFRPFLKYTPAASPLPAHVSPRRICTANAGAISKLMRLYKKLYGLRQICNIAVYMIHSACTIHLLNLPEKSARRDIIHGVKHLEEIADDWICARRTLSILSVLARKWACDLPEDAAYVLKRADQKYGHYNTSDVPSPASSHATSGMVSDDALSKSSGEHSPMGQFPQAQRSGSGLGPSSIGDRLTLMHSSQMVEEVTQRLSHQEQAVRLEGLPLDFNHSMMGRWASNPASTSSPGYDSQFFPINHRASVPQDSRQTVPRRMPTGTGNVATSGHDWMLTDGARWQHNFEGWGMGGSVPPNGVFMFSNSRSNSFHQPSGACQDDQGPPVFEGLTASLSGGGWLPGLD